MIWGYSPFSENPHVYAVSAMLLDAQNIACNMGSVPSRLGGSTGRWRQCLASAAGGFFQVGAP
jgi:hypothetical protein